MAKKRVQANVTQSASDAIDDLTERCGLTRGVMVERLIVAGLVRYRGGSAMDFKEVETED